MITDYFVEQFFSSTTLNTLTVQIKDDLNKDEYHVDLLFYYSTVLPCWQKVVTLVKSEKTINLHEKTSVRVIIFQCI